AGERQRQDEERHRTAEQLRTLAACAPVGLALWDRRGECVFSNRVYQEALGGGKSAATVHPEDRHLVEEWQVALRRGQGLAREVRVQDGEGTVRWVRLRCQAARAEQGDWLGQVAVLEDISEGKKAESELAELQRRAEAVKVGAGALE